MDAIRLTIARAGCWARDTDTDSDKDHKHKGHCCYSGDRLFVVEDRGGRGLEAGLQDESIDDSRLR